MQGYIAATRHLLNNEQVANVHLTQVWAAAVSALSCDRMINLIPTDLRDSPEVTAELRQKGQEHLSMWEERLTNL